MASETGEAKGQILAAARRIFAERGYDGASVDSIVRTAGVSKGAFYWHFESKFVLFRDLMQREVDRIEDIFLVAGELPSDDPVGALIDKGERYLSELQADHLAVLLWTHLTMEARRGNEELRRMTLEISHSVSEGLASGLREAFSVFRDPLRAPSFSAEELILLLNIFFDGFIMNIRVYGDFDGVRSLWRRLVRRLLEGGESYAA